uniref:Cilia- and flagella-associated protein 263 n=1 Tax=Physcomitrium patens TaxID=3218 RepID=A0A7I4BEQ8_PHYPA
MCPFFLPFLPFTVIYYCLLFHALLRSGAIAAMAMAISDETPVPVRDRAAGAADDEDDGGGGGGGINGDAKGNQTSHEMERIEPLPDVDAIRAALNGVVVEKEQVLLENSLLSDHLMRLMMRSGSGDNMQIQLDSLEELDEVYEEVEENQAYFRGRISSSGMSFNIPSPSSEGRRESGSYRLPWMRSSHEMAQALSMEERCDIAAAETNLNKEQMNIYRQESERILDELQAAYDEAELRIGEIRRDVADFHREVIVEASERGTETASSEHVLKFLQQKVRKTRSNTEKLRERNATLQGNIAKTEAALEIKKDLSDVLHAVDFDQLAIQKQQLEARLRDRENEVFRLKRENLKTEKALEKTHSQLRVLFEEYNVIKATLLERQPQLHRVREDTAKAIALKVTKVFRVTALSR